VLLREVGAQEWTALMPLCGKDRPQKVASAGIVVNHYNAEGIHAQ
jgi:hypothetical protein